MKADEKKKKKKLTERLIHIFSVCWLLFFSIWLWIGEWNCKTDCCFIFRVQRMEKQKQVQEVRFCFFF